MKERNINTTIKGCEVCGEPLEMLFPNGPILGMDRHPRMYECMRNAKLKEDMERMERERAEKISRNHSICFADKGMYDWNLKHANWDVPGMLFARIYIKNVEEMLENNRGYIFWGGVGTGKTYLVACIGIHGKDDEFFNNY